MNQQWYLAGISMKIIWNNLNSWKSKFPFYTKLTPTSVWIDSILIRDHKHELKKLNISLLMNFMELIDNLAINPETGSSIVTDKLENIFHNMHHLINTYRPHEARQTLITMMEEQIKRRKKFLDSLDEYLSFF